MLNHSAIAGFIYTVLLIGTPMLAWSIFGASMPTFTTFFDLTPYIDRYIPGAVLALTIDPGAYALGMLLPFNSILWMLISSVVCWIIINPLILKLPLSIFAEWQQEYRTGLGMSLVVERSSLWFWNGFYIGASIALALVTLIKARKYLITTFRSLI